MKNKLNCVLLVDDDEPTNFLHTLVLDESDVSEQIIAFQWAEEAIHYLQSNSSVPDVPDLILLDINMPRMNGWEFMDQYRKLPIDLTHQIKLIMLTTSVNPDDERKARSISLIHDFRTKPLTVEGVEEIVEKHFPGIL